MTLLFMMNLAMGGGGASPTDDLATKMVIMDTGILQITGG